MRIAVCDDSREDRGKLKEIILALQGDSQVDTFESGHALTDAVARGEKYTLLFCDIYMAEENGIQVAQKLLELSPETRVAFITTSREHAVEAYSLEALHYLVKPISQQDVIEVFRRLGKKLEPRHTLTIPVDRMARTLNQDEILRVESHLHNAVITCADGSVYSIRMPFGKINGMLDDSFLQIKKGVTLNMRFIAHMTMKSCVTSDQYTYLLRRDQAREIREKYVAFVKAEMDRR